MPPRSLTKMSPEEINEKVGTLSPAWARDYIRRLENLTRVLARQLQDAQQAGPLPVISQSAAAYVTQADPSSRTGVMIDNIDGAREELEAAWLSGAASAVAMSRSSGRPEDTAQPSVWTPAGITVPDGDYAPVRVVDGTANMEPVADVDPGYEVRFADFYQVRYSDHVITDGGYALVIEADSPFQVWPVSQTTILLVRGIS